MEKIKKLWLNRKFRYLVIGAWNTLAGYAIFAGMYWLLGQIINYLLIALTSHILAVSQSFFSQRQLVFRSSNKPRIEYIRFHLAHLTSLLLGMGGLGILVEKCQFTPLTAQAIVTAIIVIASYFVHQHYTFRKTSDV